MGGARVDFAPRLSYERWSEHEVLQVGGRPASPWLMELRLLADAEGAEDGREDLVGGDVLT
jgi:hypothetical protein